MIRLHQVKIEGTASRKKRLQYCIDEQLQRLKKCLTTIIFRCWSVWTMINYSKINAEFLLWKFLCKKKHPTVVTKIENKKSLFCIFEKPLFLRRLHSPQHHSSSNNSHFLLFLFRCFLPSFLKWKTRQLCNLKILDHCSLLNSFILCESQQFTVNDLRFILY